ncbi:hypothetical protein ACFY2W_36265 [Streptomyces sp. NPDC001262]|uniref:hypothetical protein n=1 Tax=Streptomyces sp. NPDC001262 TaxID=3364552 RepID=UPI00368D8AA4
MTDDISRIPTGVPLTLDQLALLLAAGHELPAPWADDDPDTAWATDPLTKAELLRETQPAQRPADGRLAERRHRPDACPDTTAAAGKDEA